MEEVLFASVHSVNLGVSFEVVFGYLKDKETIRYG